MPSSSSRQNFRLRLPRPQRVFALQCGDGQHRVRPPDRLHTRFGHSEIFGLALPDELLHHAGDIFHRHIGIDAVLIEQIDAIGSEPSQHAFRRSLDVIGTAVQPAEMLSRFQIDVPAELRGDRHRIAERSKRLAYDFLVSKRAIDFGRVEEGDAALDGRANDGDQVLSVRGRAVTHAAEPQGRNFQPAISKFALFHFISF